MTYIDLSDPAAIRKERTSWPWRVAFLIFTVLLIIATHLPGSDGGSGEHDSPDKLLHFLSFGGFAFLLWMTNWFRRFWVVTLIAIVFTIFDELTQALIAANREASGMDVAAGILGVLTASAWMTTMEPAEHLSERMRERRIGYILEEILAQPVNWFLLGVAFTAPLLLIGISLYAAAWFIFGISIANITFTIGFVAGLLLTGGLLLRMLTSWNERIEMNRPCFDCGDSLVNEELDEHGWGHCSTCGHRVHASQWITLLTPHVPLQVLISSDGPLGFVCILLYIFLAIFLGPLLLLANGHAGLASTILYAGIGIIGAMLWQWHRIRLGSAMDQSGRFCLRCNKVLSNVDVVSGLGQCPDCHTIFARISQPLSDEVEGTPSIESPSNA